MQNLRIVLKLFSAFCVLFAQAAGGESGTKTTDSGTKTADSGTKTTNPSSDAGPSADAGPSSDAGPPLDGSDDDTEPVKDTKPATIPTTCMYIWLNVLKLLGVELRFSNVVTRLTKYISCGNVDATSSQSREVIEYKAKYTQICKIFN